MLKRVRALPLAALMLVASTGPAWSWGGPGHRIVAMIAEQRLSPEARARVSRLLFDGQFTMADVSACPDALRAAEKGNLRPEEEYCVKVAGTVPKDSSPWHYIDIPIPTDAKSLEAFCPNGACIVEKLRSFTEVLRTSTDQTERRAALMYVIHLVGDIYQPLHCVERKCDQGGNLEHVNFYLKHEERVDHRLHSVWDSDLVNKAMADAKISDERVYATELLRSLKQEDAVKWAAQPFDEIAWQGHTIAAQHVYRGIPVQDFCGLQPNTQSNPQSNIPTNPQQIAQYTPITDLSAEYENQGAHIVREQLLKAGVRLARLIESSLLQ